MPFVDDLVCSSRSYWSLAQAGRVRGRIRTCRELFLRRLGSLLLHSTSSLSEYGGVERAADGLDLSLSL
jgi:hypothetical protein